MARRGKDSDPFEQINLDETFVRGAPVELSAEQREAKLRRERLRREMEEGERIAARAKQRTTSRRRSRRAPIALAGLLVVSLVGWRQLSPSKGSGPRSPVASSDHGDRLAMTGQVSTWPPAGREEAKAPLGAPLPVSKPSDRYAFEVTQPNTTRPVAYDPCRPIHLVVNARTAPAGGDVLLNEALTAVGAATGLQLRIDGPTTEAPLGKDRPPFQQDRYAGRWAPILVAWSDPQQTPALSGSTAGLGGSNPVPVAGSDQQVYVTGAVTLDGPQLAGILAEPNGHGVVRSVIEHELGHVLGLDHVQDPAQLMNPVGSREVLAFAAGDLTGLARLGQGDCFPSI